MGRGPGPFQLSVLSVLTESVIGGEVMPLTPTDIARRLWQAPSRSEVGSVRRALAGLETFGLAACYRDESDFYRRSLLWTDAASAPAGYTRLKAGRHRQARL